jgi:uncharacterized membrane protein YeaQ/YmgE (transglycosylase-associated protein family)
MEELIASFVLGLLAGLIAVRLMRQLWDWIFEWLPF